MLTKRLGTPRYYTQFWGNFRVVVYYGGRLILERNNPNAEVNPIWALLPGTLVLAALVSIPFTGPVVAIVTHSLWFRGPVARPLLEGAETASTGLTKTCSVAGNGRTHCWESRCEIKTSEHANYTHQKYEANLTQEPEDTESFLRQDNGLTERCQPRSKKPVRDTPALQGG